MMRHIINLIGPPAVGKTTFAQELTLLLPFYEVLSIDNFLHKLNVDSSDKENTAWNQLWLEALKSDYCIIESTGTSLNLGMMLDRLWRAPGTNIITVALKASLNIRRQRFHQRLLEGHVQSSLHEPPSNKQWRTEISISLNFNSNKLSPTQLAALCVSQLPTDFRDQI